ncbi:MAG: archaellin/type IV pilin N-terminal domain-containing protein [Thermoplasmataceae archaeon]
MKFVFRKDRAVSPIIATILLVAITVTLVSTAYTLISGYIPSPSSPTPTANLYIENLTSGSAGNINGTYGVSLSSVNGNISLGSVVILIIMQNGTVIEQNLGSVLQVGQIQLESNTLTINMTGNEPYLSSTTEILVSLTSSSGYISYMALKDLITGGTIGSATVT